MIADNSACANLSCDRPYFTRRGATLLGELLRGDELCCIHLVEILSRPKYP